MNMSRFWQALGALICSVTILTGCINIPTSGPVIEGERIDGGGSEQIIRVNCPTTEYGHEPGGNCGRFRAGVSIV